MIDPMDEPTNEAEQIAMRRGHRLASKPPKLLTDENAATRDPPRTAGVIKDLESLAPYLHGGLSAPQVKKLHRAIELIRLLEKETRT